MLSSEFVGLGLLTHVLVVHWSERGCSIGISSDPAIDKDCRTGNVCACSKAVGTTVAMQADQEACEKMLHVAAISAPCSHPEECNHCEADPLDCRAEIKKTG